MDIIQYVVGNWKYENIGAIDTKSFRFKESTLKSALNSITLENNKIALFYYHDIADYLQEEYPGFDYFKSKYENYTREEFEENPGVCGVCYYTNPFNAEKFIFE